MFILLMSQNTIGDNSNNNRKRKYEQISEKSVINEREQIIKYLEEEYHHAKQKHQRALKCSQLTLDCFLRQKDLPLDQKFKWYDKLNKATQTVHVTNDQVDQINLVIQSLKENPSISCIPKKFGKVEETIQNSSTFIEGIKKIFGMRITSQVEGENVMIEAFNAFEQKKKGSKEQERNLLFWNGKAYINGLLPVSQDFDYIYVNRKKFPIVQLCEVLGYKTEEIEAAEMISEGFPYLIKAITWYSIKDFWEEAKEQNNSQIDKTLDKYLGTCQRFFHKYLEWAAIYIKSSRTLKIKTKSMNFSEKGLLKSYNKAENLFEELLGKFGEYIKVFNEEDAKEFTEQVQNMENCFLEATSLCSDYSLYTHTEYIVRYLQIKNNHTGPIYMISYYDLCKDCEKLFVECTKEEKNKDNTIVISGMEYKCSRQRGRPNILCNKSFLQIQYPY